LPELAAPHTGQEAGVDVVIGRSVNGPSL
jgi:hypothetical protein